MPELIAQIGKLISENILPIIGLVIAAITAVGVFYGPRLVAKSQEKKEKLKKHFNDLQEGAIEPLANIAAGVDIVNGSITTHNRNAFAHLDAEQFEGFQAHYPILGGQWQELAGIWTKRHGFTGGRWVKHNEKVEAFENQIREAIEKKCTQRNISLPIKRFSTNEELINDDLPNTLRRILFEKSQGKDTDRNFDEANIIEKGEFYVIELSPTQWANARTRDTVEKCKSIFIDIENSLDLIEEAYSIIREAEQTKDEFEKLLSNLEKIKSRGLISKDPNYKFKPVRNCPICKELFY